MTRIYVKTLVLAIAMTLTVVFWATKPAMAQANEIPVYVQIHLNKTIKNAAAKGDIIRIKKMDLNSIVAMLDHKNHRVASAAAYALGEIRDAKAVPSRAPPSNPPALFVAVSVFLHSAAASGRLLSGRLCCRVRGERRPLWVPAPLRLRKPP